LKFKKEEIPVVVFAGRNAPGAKWFEYPKVWEIG